MVLEVVKRMIRSGELTQISSLWEQLGESEIDELADFVCGLPNEEILNIEKSLKIVNEHIAQDIFKRIYNKRKEIEENTENKSPKSPKRTGRLDLELDMDENEHKKIEIDGEYYDISSIREKCSDDTDFSQKIHNILTNRDESVFLEFIDKIRAEDSFFALSLEKIRSSLVSGETEIGERIETEKLIGKLYASNVYTAFFSLLYVLEDESLKSALKNLSDSVDDWIPPIQDILDKIKESKYRNMENLLNKKSKILASYLKSLEENGIKGKLAESIILEECKKM